LRDTLMLARGVEATVQCSPRLAHCLDGPTIARGEPLHDFAAAAPLRSLPHLLHWEPRALPPPLALRPRPQAGPAVGWFSQSEPPSTLVIERDVDRVAACRLVVGDDVWPTHLAAALGIPSVMLLPAAADWLWGPQRGISPWYANLEVLSDRDGEKLAARLAQC
jgi:hypothetical protein